MIVRPYFGSSASLLELEFGTLAARITETGFPFDVAAGQQLLTTLSDSSGTLAESMQALMPPLIEETEWTPKRNNKTRGLVAGVPAIKRKQVPFNPNSPDHIRKRIYEANNIQPTMFTDSGLASTKAEALAQIDLEEARLLTNYKVASKLRSMVAGPSGWLMQVSADGRLRTRYFTLGTVTGRCSHKPNVAQVPKIRKSKDRQILRGAAGHWGYECRACFTVPPEWPDGWLVGIDQSGLELRVLGNYLAPYDHGAYSIIACDDPHANNAALLDISKESAKTFAYATIYGAGSYRLGHIIMPDLDDEYETRWVGEDSKQALIQGIAGFKELYQWLDQQEGTYIEGLDGRPLFVRKKYARLNTLLQAGGSVICKRWACLTDSALQELHLHPYDDYQIVAHIHDELQIAARNREVAEIVADVGVRMAVEAGRYYNLRCPTAGAAAIGKDWANTH